MNFRHFLGSLRRHALCSLYRRTVRSGNTGPIVSFTFDDFPRTAYTAGAPILESFGARGTYYVAGGLMKRSGDLGELFSAGDLLSLVDRGHELGTQTFQHSSSRKLSLAAFADDVQKGMQFMEQIGVRNATNFAYPYGHITLRSKKILGPIFTSSRSVIPGLNGPDVDLNLLRANRLYGDIDQKPFVEDLILQNEKEKSWLIFYTHDVRRDPSEYGCTPGLMEYAVARAARGGSRILSVQQALAEFGVQQHMEVEAPKRAAAVSV